MSAPGWYPDPTSQDGSLRYWDGSSWTQQTMERDGKHGGGGKPWLWFGLAMVLVIGLVVLLITRPGNGTDIAGGDDNSAKPTGSQWDELPQSDPPSSPEDPGEEGETVECPRHMDEDRSELSADGRLHGGGLSIVPPDGWTRIWTYMPGVVDHNSMSRQIVPGWISSISVAALNKSDGFTDPQLAAQAMMQCMASSQLFASYTSHEDILSQAYRLDGHSGWRMTTKIYVDDPQEVDGDVVDVIVVDTGDPERLSIYVSAATIDLQDNLDEVAESLQTLRVEG